MFHRSTTKPSLKIKLISALIVIMMLSIQGTILYVIGHFIIKYW
jgi:hypothetical protein